MNEQPNIGVNTHSKSGGFTLVEIAIVLFIVALLLGSLVPILSSQIEQRRTSETRKTLEEIKDALLGFAVANGRLPCPASSSSNGQESFCTNGGPPGSTCGIEVPTPTPTNLGRCFAPYNGWLPAAALGLAPLDSQGYVRDAWDDGSITHRIRYAVSQYRDSTTNLYFFTDTDGMKNATMATLSTQNHLFVCNTGLTTAPSTTVCAPMTMLTNKTPAIIFSLGKNAAATSFDETNNQNGDVVFSAGEQKANFDDIVTWISLNTLFNRMVAAGKLP